MKQPIHPILSVVGRRLLEVSESAPEWMHTFFGVRYRKRGWRFQFEQISAGCLNYLRPHVGRNLPAIDFLDARPSGCRDTDTPWFAIYDFRDSRHQCSALPSGPPSTSAMTCAPHASSAARFSAA